MVPRRRTGWMKPYKTYEKALAVAWDNMSKGTGEGALPTWLPLVIEQKEKPDTGVKSTLRIRVERITINEVD